MKVLFDIYHLPQVNLFKNTIRSLDTSEVIITTVNRGKLVQVLKYEFPQYDIRVFGDYKYNKGFFTLVSKIVIPRMILLFKMIKRDKVSVVLSSGYQSNVIAKLKKIPSFIITDDYRIFHPIIKHFTTKVYMPDFMMTQKKINTFHALKEWSYLSPRYFKPDPDVLNGYSLNKKDYIFIREVSTESLNYIHQLKNIVSKVALSIPKNISVLFSLENKNYRDLYPKEWILLKEPVKDVHSLMYYSKCVISSGDSMAREGAMMGVRSIYLGERDMPANNMLIKDGFLIKCNVNDFPGMLNRILNENDIITKQLDYRRRLQEEWIDVTELIKDLIKKHKK